MKEQEDRKQREREKEEWCVERKRKQEEKQVKKVSSKRTKSASKGKILPAGSISKGKEQSIVDRTPCRTCGDLYCEDNSGRNWIQCQQPLCNVWYHNACQGLEENGLDIFFCIKCNDSDTE